LNHGRGRANGDDVAVGVRKTFTREGDGKMASEPSNSTSEHREHREHRHRRPHRKFHRIRDWARRFWLEISAVSLLSAGIFLLVERLKIKVAIWNLLVGLYRRAGHAVRSVRDGATYLLERFETSDLAGIVFITLAACLIIHRIRRRAISRHPDIDNCPRCGGHLNRRRRSILNRLALRFAAIRASHYVCAKCSFRYSYWRSTWED